MLSKILVRSGLSRLLWIKDAVSHRLDGCVLELYGLLVVCLIYSLAAYRLFRLVPRRFRSRLPCTNLFRVSRFRLLVKPARLYTVCPLSILLVDLAPRARKTAQYSAETQRITSSATTLSARCPGAMHTAPKLSNQLEAQTSTSGPGRVPLLLCCSILGLLGGPEPEGSLSSTACNKRLDCVAPSAFGRSPTGDRPDSSFIQDRYGSVKR